MKKSVSGFTIVELLIVIVVIAILASISVVAYTGIRARADDSRRLSDANGIIKALTIYHAYNGSFPGHTSGGSWEQSNTEASGQFMEYLANYGFPGGTPTDPANTSTRYYRYYRYSAGSYGCDASRGNFYVFSIRGFDSVSGTHPQSPGFSCSGRDWGPEASWTTGGFEN